MRKRESMITFYAFVVCLDKQDIVVMIFGVKPVLSPTIFKKLRLKITAMYGRNFKPKIFTDITMPAKQSYDPNIGKIFAIYLESLKK